MQKQHYFYLFHQYKVLIVSSHLFFAIEKRFSHKKKNTLVGMSNVPVPEEGRGL